MKVKLKLIVLICYCLVTLAFTMQKLQCQTYPEDRASLLLKDIGNADSDSVKIEYLFSLAHYYYDYLGDERKADSISEIALEVAVSTYRPEMLVFSYNLYLESNDLSAYYNKSVDYAQKALQYGKNMNSSIINCRSCKNLASVYLAGYQYDKSMEFGFRALSMADGLNDELLKAESYLVIGQSLEGKNQAVEAFRNYLSALAISQRLEDEKLLGKCYARLSSFYQNNKIFDKATFYKLKQGDLLKEEGSVDSLAMMWIVYDLQVIAMHANSKLTEKFTANILAYAKRHKVDRLKEFEMALYRSYLVKHDKIEQLYKLYLEKFPDEYSRLRIQNSALYFTLQAYFYEYEKKADSAYFSFTIAEKQIKSSPNKILQSNFYNRFGLFLLRQNNPDEAIQKFTKSYELAHLANYSEYMLKAVEQLEILFAEIGQYKNAYKYTKLKSELLEKFQKASKKDQMVLMEINHETDQRILSEELQKKRIERRHNIQYTGIIIGILSVFVLLIMFGSFTVPKWVIQMLGFFSFIFLFEFIILLADNSIHHWTHGEPWKILLIKIFLIAFLLPFHHWIEKRVVDYLLNHRLINFSDFSPIGFLKKITGIGLDEKRPNED